MTSDKSEPTVYIISHFASSSREPLVVVTAKGVPPPSVLKSPLPLVF